MVLFEEMLNGMLKSVEPTPLAQLLDALPMLRYVGHPTYGWMKRYMQARDEYLNLLVPAMKVDYHISPLSCCKGFRM